MDITKDTIKELLRVHGKDRAWLAERLGKKLPTINNWLSTNVEIPSGMLPVIGRIFAELEAEDAQRRLSLMPRSQIFSLEVDLSTYRAYNAASLAAGKTLEQWSIDELNAAAEQALAEPEAAPAPDPKKPNAA